MVNFVIGRSGTGKSTVVCDEIVREIREGSRQVVLIVPEQQTVVWETKMARILPPSANFRLEITNFTRLANSVFREFGGLADKVVDEGTRSLLIWRAMVSVWDQLQVYNHCMSGREDRNIPYLMSAVDELKNSGISPEMAEKALDALIKERSENESGKNAETFIENSDKKTSSGDLISRLSDAVLVYSAYNSLLHEEYIDRGDLLDNLAKTLAKHDYFHGKCVFIDSFYSLTKAEERIVGEIMKQSDDVVMTFTCPTKGNSAPKDEKEIDGNDAESEKEIGVNEEIQFMEITRYLRTATSLALRAGQEIKRTELRENLRHKNAPELALIEKYLFNYSGGISADDISMVYGNQSDNSELNETENELKEHKEAKNVQIIACTDVYDEAEACASIVDKLIRQGYKYSEIAVVARNIKTCEGVIDSALRRHGVRYFISETTDAANLPAVKFVLTALAVAASGWQRKEIIAHLKTGLTLVGKEIDGNAESGIDIENASGSGINTSLEGDIFEIYTETWNIRGRKSYTDGPWSMNPAGYKTERTEIAEEMLKLANSAREKLVVPLDNLISVFENSTAEVREIAERIVQYAEDCKLYDGLEKSAESYRSLGLLAEAEKTLNSWDKVCEILDRMVETLGETKLDAGRFAGLFARAASKLDVGTIPTGVDEITLGSAAGVRFDEAKCVIVIGAVEGEFPASVADTGSFFGERDKIALEGVGLEMGNLDLAERTAREHFMFYRTVASARDYLYILTPSANDSEFSEGAKRVEQILNSIGKKCTNKFAEKCLKDVIYNKNTAEYLISRRVKIEEIKAIKLLAGNLENKNLKIDLSADNTKVKNAQNEVLENDETAEIESLNGQNISQKMYKMTLSQTKIESFITCPFNFWCKYQMKLGVVPKAEIGNPEIGTFMHAVLEKFFSGLTEEQMQNMPLSDRETERIADEIIENYVNSLAKNGLGVIEMSGKIALDGRLSYLFLRLRRHVLVFLKALMREFAQSQFRPVAYEKPIGLADGVVPMVIRTDTGIEITLRGVADRIDEFVDENGKKFVRIVDYKTGSKTFSIDDVKRGLNVQLLIYLFSVCRNGIDRMNKYTEFVPAGAIYFQAKPTSISAEKFPSEDKAIETAVEKIERSGAILKDEDVIRAMDSELSGKIVKVKLDSSGDLKETQKSTSLLTLEEFGQLEKDLEDVIGKIGERIVSGEANADPMLIGGKSPCDWCENRFVCRNVRY